jgi:hypothetical protein
VPSFWSLRNRGGVAQSAVEVSGAAEPVLAPVELYTADDMVTGFVADRGFRLSDILNEVSLLPVERPKRISFDDREDAAGEELHLDLETDRILLAMPPGRTSSPQMRVHRRRSRVRILTSRYEVIGTAHHLPGSSLDPYVLRTRHRFIAVTDASVRTVTQPYLERNASVVLVNVGPIAELKQVITLT